MFHMLTVYVNSNYAKSHNKSEDTLYFKLPKNRNRTINHTLTTGIMSKKPKIPHFDWYCNMPCRS
jgi:beta-galactosidase/beta-glucuronidase